MKTGLGFLLGCICALAVVALVGYLSIVNGWIPARGDEPAGDFEKWAAHHALHAVLEREAPTQSPIPADEPNLMAGAKLYADQCAGCHGAPKNPTPAFANGFSPGPTLFGNGDTVTDDPEGYTYWKIEHGIKFTGMPAFKGQLKENEIWQLSMFLKHMDKLPPKVETLWKNMH
jgi:mono/diheme cytochrome c family protein